ncbi:hypothetical protein O3G_MSEX002714 [Manduca sexta]|uniref:Uncharacterized protein n=1 Tax=Manduca sexta TaxID=7130 RepID=A0A921YPS4_MANSE|nr:hypothetical protein O3G_MSEX002714 [Manduca sexta]
MLIALKSDARNIILKVLNFKKEENRLLTPIIPYEILYERVVAVIEAFNKITMNE